MVKSRTKKEERNASGMKEIPVSLLNYVYYVLQMFIQFMVGTISGHKDLVKSISCVEVYFLLTKEEQQCLSILYGLYWYATDVWVLVVYWYATEGLSSSGHWSTTKALYP